MTDRIEAREISGFPEWSPKMKLVEERFIRVIADNYRLYGFTPIETPAVESWDALTAKGGMHRQIYSVGKPQEGSHDVELGLHFDLTVPLARYVATHLNELTFPFRRYQIQKVWRGERKQKGRFREFYQCDVDVVGRGKLDPIHDAEIPCVIQSTFDALGVPDFQINLSNRKALESLTTSRGATGETFQNAVRAIDKIGRSDLDKLSDELTKNQIGVELIPAILDFIQAETIADARTVFARVGASVAGLDELEQVHRTAVALGIKPDRLKLNFAIARGLDYYTGTVYETTIKEREEWGSVCSGGRYDDLASLFTNQKLPGVGISIGLTRLLHRMLDAGLLDVGASSPTAVLVTMQDRQRFSAEYLEIARTLRSAGVPTEVAFEATALRDQFGYANSLGIPLAVIAGETEINAGQVTLRDLRDRSQQVIDRSALVDRVREKLGMVADR
jgi:histidyl-tRNA synthetase